MGIQADLSASVGRTSLIRLRHASELTGCEVSAKAELLSPGGSSGTAPRQGCSDPFHAPVPAWLEQALPDEAPARRQARTEAELHAFAKAL